MHSYSGLRKTSLAIWMSGTARDGFTAGEKAIFPFFRNNYDIFYIMK